MKDLSNYRKSYEKNQLIETNLPNNPLELFEQWFIEAEDSGKIEEVNAMTIATIGLDGFPKSRVVLLKEYSQEGFIFYTNYNSHKGQSIQNNPNVCLSFFWANTEKQIIIKGIATKTSEKVSDDYFNSRPTGSKLGAIVSNQSQVIPSRELLENKLRELEQFYKDIAITRPVNWGGFIVKPIEIEFWQGRPNRLHDRIIYKNIDNQNWETQRLSS